jgi:rSAM/selenodomain-associated transferase 2
MAILKSDSEPAELSRIDSSGLPSLTVIIPTLNEQEHLPGLLRQLSFLNPGPQIIVADGGSRDSTLDHARTAGAIVLSCPPGRARQMNSAAAHATGDLLWFLHADSILPDDAARLVQEAMKEERWAGGCFQLEIPARGLAYRICDRWGNLGVDLFKLTCGDHGIFVRRSVFHAVGGYPEITPFEDVELYRRIQRWGRVRQLRSKIVTSPRRWEAHGPWMVTLTYLLLWAMYLCGASPQRLEKTYRKVSDSVTKL